MSLEWLQYMDLNVIGKPEGEELAPWLFYTYLCVSILCVCTAGLMSGLTLGFFSLDEVDLEVGPAVCKLGGCSDHLQAELQQQCNSS
jgi:hypothetical protein